MTLPDRVADLMPFDLLLSVARLGSVGLAAQAHGISQPAASTRIRRLERRLGVTLIERSPHGSRLTPQGELVAGWAQAAVDAAAALDAGLTSLRERSDAVLRVVASMTVAEYLLPGWLTALHARHQHTKVMLTAGNSEEVAAAVLGGTADIGFVEGPDLPPGLTARQAGRDTLTVVVAPGHPWARRRSGITAAELAAAPLVARSRPRARGGRWKRRCAPRQAWSGCRRRPSCRRPPRSNRRSWRASPPRCSARSPSPPSSRPGRCARSR